MLGTQTGIQFYNVDSMQMVRNMIFAYNNDPIKSICVDDEGIFFSCAHRSGYVTVWNAKLDEQHARIGYSIDTMDVVILLNNGLVLGKELRRIKILNPTTAKTLAIMRTGFIQFIIQTIYSFIHTS